MTKLTKLPDDCVVGFLPQGLPARGRVIRLSGTSLSSILKRHGYPDHLAEILGEALMLSALVGSGLKFNGEVLVQAEGDGPVSLLVGAYAKNGKLRAYSRHDAAKWNHLHRVNRGAKPHMPQLFGESGRLGMIIVHDDKTMKPWQSLVPLTHASLVECAESCFSHSEQIETRLKLSIHKTADNTWRGGGMMIQKIAGDDTRGHTDDGWREAQALFATLDNAELTDPALSVPDLLYRLFHQKGVMIDNTHVVLRDACKCDRDRLVAMLRGMDDNALREMTEGDGTLDITCQFCARQYKIPAGEITGMPHPS